MSRWDWLRKYLVLTFIFIRDLGHKFLFKKNSVQTYIAQLKTKT